MFLEMPRELRHEPHPRGGKGMAPRDRPAPRVDPRIVVGDAEMIEEGEDLDGESLVDLEQANVVDAEAGLGERLLRGRDRAYAHHLRLDAGKGEGDQPHPHG